MDIVVDAYATHQPVLLYAVGRTDKPVLELGSGNNSTVQIHDMLKDSGIKILPVDDNLEWMNKYIHLRSPMHEFIHLNDHQVKLYYKEDTTQWGVVFVDNGTWDARSTAVLRYKDTADFVVVHDCNYPADNGLFGKSIKPFDFANNSFGVRNYDDVFKYWIEFMPERWIPTHPPTLLGSNKICLDDVEIEGMIISCRSNILK